MFTFVFRLPDLCSQGGRVKGMMDCRGEREEAEDEERRGRRKGAWRESGGEEVRGGGGRER